jgi:hypothetical protein
VNAQAISWPPAELEKVSFDSSGQTALNVDSLSDSLLALAPCIAAMSIATASTTNVVVDRMDISLLPSR